MFLLVRAFVGWLAGHTNTLETRALGNHEPRARAQTMLQMFCETFKRVHEKTVSDGRVRPSARTTVSVMRARWFAPLIVCRQTIVTQTQTRRRQRARAFVYD